MAERRGVRGEGHLVPVERQAVMRDGLVIDPAPAAFVVGAGDELRPGAPDRKRVVVGKSVSVRVDLGGRRLIKNKRLHILTKTPKTNITLKIHTSVIRTHHSINPEI